MAEERAAGYVPALRFAWLTPAYDLVVRATTREKTFKNALVEQAGLRHGHRVLDLGCGTGTLTIQMAQRCAGAVVTGVDGDPAILELAARKAATQEVSVQFDRALASALPYPDGTFDRVVSSLFFHHLSWHEKERAAREAFRVLRPGGELHVADWGRAGSPLMRCAFLAVRLLDGFENTRDNVQGRLPALFAQAGLREVQERTTFATVLGTLALYRGVKTQ
jgi:ubiquinone/menaquinone biosynthesis C-methylase UbiE